MTNILWACAFVLVCIGFYRFGLPRLKRFDQANVARQAAILQLQCGMLHYAALIDRYCRSDPYNWFNFFDFWREPDFRSRRSD